MSEQNQTSKVEQSKIPTSGLAGRQKTMHLQVEYKSDIIHEFLRRHSGAIFGMYERIGGLKRMLSTDSNLSQMVNDWLKANNSIAEAQLAQLTNQTELIILNSDITLENVEFNIPADYKFEFIASHPVVREMIALITKADEQIEKSENIYFQGLIDDAQLNMMRKQSIGILTGIMDRIAKATKPGKRVNGAFSPADLARHMREGNSLMFSDLPLEMRELIAEYEHKYTPDEKSSTEEPEKSDVSVTSKNEKDVKAA